MVEIIYENSDWLPFFQTALDEIEVPFRLNFIEEMQLDLNQPPDNIIYLNRVSPSCHSRGHHQSIIRGEQYLDFLASYNRKVINGVRTIGVETSKVLQYKLLQRFGILFPETVFSSEIDELLEMAKRLTFPVLTKHNRSGKGLGIKKFDRPATLRDYLHSKEYIPSPDGILLAQEYIEPKDNRITRVELTDGKLVYAFHSSCEQGFELCPADACRIDQPQELVSTAPLDGNLFEYIENFEHPLVVEYIELAEVAAFDMVGIEFVENSEGATYTYDINGTTNYSPDVEKASGHLAKKAFQRLIKKLL